MGHVIHANRTPPWRAPYATTYSSTIRLLSNRRTASVLHCLAVEFTNSPHCFGGCFHISHDETGRPFTDDL